MWWAQLASTRMNIGPIILSNQIEEGLEILEIGAFLLRRCLGSIEPGRRGYTAATGFQPARY